jgi:hypothetical protein
MSNKKDFSCKGVHVVRIFAVKENLIIGCETKRPGCENDGTHRGLFLFEPL